MSLPSLSCIKYNRPYLKHESKRNSNVRSKRLMKAAGVKSQRAGERAAIEEQLSHAAEICATGGLVGYMYDPEELNNEKQASGAALDFIDEDCQVCGGPCILDIDPEDDDSEWDEF